MIVGKVFKYLFRLLNDEIPFVSSETLRRFFTDTDLAGWPAPQRVWHAEEGFRFTGKTK
jgi:hypothetical protein